MCKGCLSPCPGVGRVCCDRVSTYIPALPTHFPDAPSTGVPACPVPAHELIEVAPVRFGHALDEIVAGDRLAIVVAEVQVHAVAKALMSQQRVQHADDFGAFFVDGGSVEVVDFLVAVGADRVRHRAGIFGKLRGAQHAHVLDALDRASRSRALPSAACASMSAENCWSRKTVSPSFRVSWNQSRQVTRLPVQLWKYSWATTDSMCS
jgi:hypothetical protein